MVRTTQCKTPHFPKHKFPIHATRNVQTQLKPSVLRYMELTAEYEIQKTHTKHAHVLCILNHIVSVSLFVQCIVHRLHNIGAWP